MRKKILITTLSVIFLGILYTIIIYNSIVKKEEKVKQDWSEVQNTYQRRMDLIPNLVSVVRGVSDFEKGVLQKIAELRSKAPTYSPESDINSSKYYEQKRLQDSLALVVNRLILLMEDYPDLKATKAYSGLQVQLEGTERRIRVARQDFNESVNQYNRRVKSFPSNIIAYIFGFQAKEGFESVKGSEKAVEINFHQ